MYEEYYNLNSDPFALSPSGKASYEHSSYKKARSYLEYALYRGEGIVLVTGQPGTGKTTLIKELLQTLHGSDTVVLAFTCQTFSAKELVSQFARTLRPGRNRRRAVGRTFCNTGSIKSTSKRWTSCGIGTGRGAKSDRRGIRASAAAI